MTNTEQLRTNMLDKIKELFQLDQPDLDFGFYRIMHSRAKEITEFIEHDLLDTVKAAFDSAKVESSKTDFDAAKARVIDAIGDDAFDENGALKAMYANSKAGKEFLAAQRKLADSGTILSGEDSVYYHLYRFFSRYYKDGDFISMRYHTRETDDMAKPYAVPYGGEEVMLHWANADQYYIKTAENFRNFSFDLTKAKLFETMGREEKILAGIPEHPLMVHFKVVEAEEGEHGNIKTDPNQKREFFLAPDQAVALNRAGELEIHFEYRVAEESDALTPADETLVKELYGAKNKGDFKQLAMTAKIMSACHDLKQRMPGTNADSALISDFITVMEYACPTDAVKKRILLSKYLYQYTARNTSDYFIHKNLRGFLRREMDFYIKNEIMNLDDVENSDVFGVENYLLLLKVFRKIAGKLIDFLGQLEDFQKKLWLKKKFVVQCDYCITLDRVPEEFYPEIIRNLAQWSEWENCGFLRTECDDQFSLRYTKKTVTKLTVQFEDIKYPFFISLSDPDELLIMDNHGMKEWKPGTSRIVSKRLTEKEFFSLHSHLMVDTKFFDGAFKERLLAEFDDLDAQCDGLLIHSENFQALNLLQERYREQVKCIYIDPPYNTGGDGFIYRDNYQHSSWLSMMYDRLFSAKNLLLEAGIFFGSIDENELMAFRSLLSVGFGNSNISELIWKKRGGGDMSAGRGSGLSVEHEYVMTARNTDSAYYEGFDVDSAKFANPDNDPAGPWTTQDLTCNKTKEERPTLFYDIIDPFTGIVYHCNPKRVWGHEKKKMEAMLNRTVDGRLLPKIIFPKSSNGRPVLKKFLHERISTKNPFLSLLSSEQAPLNSNATKEFFDLFNLSPFTFPKSTGLMKTIVSQGSNKASTILDYFAGSGTTGHAVINLNREDGGKRKYILVEMGNHFDTVLKPRIEKVVYSQDWKDGKPVPKAPVKLKQKIHHNETIERDGNGNELTLSFDIGLDSQTLETNEDFKIENPFNGVSHCFKYMRLESYEDTLNNLVMPETDTAATAMPPSLKKDYMLHYLLDSETRDSLLNIRDFSNPFGGYRLNVKQPDSDASVSTTVDLIETFHYLIGLRVEQYYRIQSYSASFKRSADPELPDHGAGQRTRLELAARPELEDEGKWRFQKIEGKIPANPLSPNDGQTKNVLILWRTLTGNLEQDNLMLDWYLGDTINLNEKRAEYDIIYVNGSNTLGADRKETDSYQVRLIEEEFLKKMWSGEEY